MISYTHAQNSLKTIRGIKRWDQDNRKLRERGKKEKQDPGVMIL